MTASKQNKLHAVFASVRYEAPHLVADASPLALGSNSLLVENADNSIRKILFWPQTGAQAIHKAQEELYNETSALLLLSASEAADFTPRLLSDVTFEPKSPDILATYSMSKMAGASRNWFNPEIRQSPLKADYFESVGRLLARFHEAAKDLPFADSTHKGMAMAADKIHSSSLHSAATNAALEQADAYLQAHRQTGVVHGDFHGGNVMTNPHLQATGLIDFSTAGYAANLYADMVFLPPDGEDDFARGYESQSHRALDRKLLHATRIAFESLRLKDMTDMGLEQMSGSIADDVEKHLKAFENTPA